MDKNYIYFSTDAKEKHLTKLQHPFMIKTFNKLGIKGSYLDIIKTIYEEPTAQWQKNWKLFLYDYEQTKGWTSTLSFSIQHNTGSPSQSS